MATPVCPRDATPLTPTKDVFGPGTEAHTCPKCAGVQVKWDTAQKFFTSLGLSLTDLQVMVKHQEGKQRNSDPLACTACGKGAMKPLVHKGIELDLCESCGTTWFDGGELQRISGGKLGKGVERSAQPVAGERGKVVGVFEMFWDCAYCDAKALLGKSNRFCPSCGAQQDATKRYFPPPGKEVAANTQYDGADWACNACQTPNGAKANNCRNCGSPKDGAAEVARVADKSSAAPKPNQVKPAQGKSKWPYIIGGVVVLAIAFCLVAMFWTKDVAMTVTAHSWDRTIDIEELRAVSDSSWCDSTPNDAYSVSRRREQRSTKQIPDGETCTTRNVDRGDGTFERREECKTKYRSEPVYDDKCYYTVDRWKVSRSAKAAGAGVDPAPAWPKFTLSRTGNSLGCEREGGHHENYTLSLKGADGKTYTCTQNQTRWQSLADGYKKVIPVGVITGHPECDKL
ncbi:MAG: zf-TFIIB domain-containing protein [Myxococcaceae bacterium]